MKILLFSVVLLGQGCILLGQLAVGMLISAIRNLRFGTLCFLRL
jgi:hypothetical protein